MNGGSTDSITANTDFFKSERTDFESGFHGLLFDKSWKHYFDLFPKCMYMYVWFSE